VLDARCREIRDPQSEILYAVPAVPRLFLIDGNSQMYRAYHAIHGLTGPDGRSTNAVYGFVTMLRKLVADHQPEYVAASFDVGRATIRTEIAADYKANRAPMPPDLVEQISWVHQACEALGVPILVAPGYEADDVIGTLAVRAADSGFEVAIVTGDKDFFQLVGGAIKVYNPRDEGAWYDEAAVLEKFGVAPAQVVDVLALMGDASDNIKGVPGIGDKGARELITAFGSLDRLLERTGDVAQRRYREALLAGADSARLSRELARIRTGVAVPFEPEALRYRGASRERCYELFGALGFRSLVKEFAPAAEPVARDYHVVRTEAELASLVSDLRAAGACGMRVVTDGAAPMRARIVGFSFSTRAGHARYVPVGHSGLDGLWQLDSTAALRTLAPIFGDAAVRKSGHDLKADAVVLARHGVPLAGLDTDTMLASYLLDATRASQAIEPLALEELDHAAVTEEDVCGRGAKALGIDQLPIDAVLDYAGERADLALRLSGRLRPRLADEGLVSLYESLELPLVPVLAELELAGVRIDAAALSALSQSIEQDLIERSRRIFELSGAEFNINSPKQLSEILFDKLQLPALKKTGKTRAASTAVDVLEELALTHDLPREILEWRALQKLKGTYIDALPQLVNPATGRVHTSFNQAVAATGRLSSSEPNLQNVPIRTPLGREIRRAFIADPGSVLISADYSQIELRVLAHLSADEALIDAFRRGEDIHDRTAQQIFGAASGIDRHELRRRAKMVNYALLYGKTAFTLARDIGVPVPAAQSFIDSYFAGFPGVRAFIDRTLADARRSGVVRTMAGRRRFVPELTSKNGQIRAAAERVTVNMPIQGAAADILKRAMLDVHAALGHAGLGARMILTVHDELLFETPREGAAAVAALVRDTMERAADLAVPLTVDVGIGGNWKEAKT
jgi:DNA polymerase-1